MDLERLARKLRIPHFRGVFMRDNLPKRPWRQESAIVNLDGFSGQGTHWVCFRKSGNLVDYFDSYGDLRPPCEVQRYLKGNFISHNRTAYQFVNSNSETCGQLCLAFLSIVK